MNSFKVFLLQNNILIGRFKKMNLCSYCNQNIDLIIKLFFFHSLKQSNYTIQYFFWVTFIFLRDESHIVAQIFSINIFDD